MSHAIRHRPLISADSHVIEPTDVWEGLLPDGFWADETFKFAQRPGGFDPRARAGEMDVDGVSAEVLYPSLAMRLFSIEDPQLQQRCFRRYNEWLADYCEANPERLLGIGLVPAYDMAAAVAEVQWCQEHGMRGLQVWQTPPAGLPFSGTHYEPLWEAASEARLSVSLHILTGFGYAIDMFKYGRSLVEMGLPLYKMSITQKLLAMQDALLDIVMTGVLDRHRHLRFVLVENECAWMPFFVEQCDYYYGGRFGESGPIRLDRPPSEACRDQIFVTFFRDPNVELVVRSMGDTNVMWSSDYPHGTSTWPDSQAVVSDRLRHTPEESVHRVVWANACEVFGITLDPAAA